MPRWLEIVATLALFAAGMAVLSWGVSATAPGAFDWLADQMGDAMALVIVGVILSGCGLYGWLGHRPTKGRAGNLDGR